MVAEIADIELILRVEGQAGGQIESLGKSGDAAVRIDSIDRSGTIVCSE